MPALTNDQISNIQTTARVTSVLSLVGGLAVLGDIFRKWHRRSGTNQLVLWWTVADLVSVPATMLSRYFIDRGEAALASPSPGCVAQGFLFHFGFMASQAWAVCVAFNLMAGICWHKPSKELNKYQKFYHLFAWGIATLMAGVPLIYQGPQFYGDSTGVASVQHTPRIVWYAFSFAEALVRIANSTLQYWTYIEIWLLLLTTFVIYLRVGVYINQGSSRARVRSSKSKFHARWAFFVKASSYLLGSVLTFTGATVNRIHAMINPDDPVYALYMFQVGTMPLGGAYNAAIYFMSYRLKERTTGGMAKSVIGSAISAQARATVSMIGSMFKDPTAAASAPSTAPSSAAGHQQDHPSPTTTTGVEIKTHQGLLSPGTIVDAEAGAQRRRSSVTNISIAVPTQPSSENQFPRGIRGVLRNLRPKPGKSTR